MNTVLYFKRRMKDKYTYYKVYGGPGGTLDGYQEVINFLNEVPIISIEHNYDDSQKRMNYSGTWDTYETGELINRSEYDAAYKRATRGNFEIK